MSLHQTNCIVRWLLVLPAAWISAIGLLVVILVPACFLRLSLYGHPLCYVLPCSGALVFILVGMIFAPTAKGLTGVLLAILAGWLNSIWLVQPRSAEFTEYNFSCFLVTQIFFSIAALWIGRTTLFQQCEKRVLDSLTGSNAT